MSTVFYMKYFFTKNKTVTLLPMLALFLLLSTAARAAVEPPQSVRIGLSWGDNAVPSANLLNFTGSGYRYGYFDAQSEFVELGFTDKTAITMLKDWTMYRYSGKYSTTAPSDGTDYKTVGCYHIRLNTEYYSYEEAAASMLDAEGSPLYSDAFIAYHNGVWYVCLGDYINLASAQAAADERAPDGTAMTASSACITVVDTETAEIIFQFDCGNDHSLAVMPAAQEDEIALTWYKQYKYYGAFQFTRIDGGNLTVVNILSVDDYIKGVVPYEMSPGWPVEALKAQAVTARTYMAAHLNAHKKYGFDLCSGVCCQTYHGANGASEQSDLAVEETNGIYMTYDGEYANTFYYSSNGGATEDCCNVFYEDIPYLKGKLDPYEQYVETGYENWSYTYTAVQITNILQSKGYSCARIVSITPTYTDNGNIYSLKFTDANGETWTFSKERAGSILYSSQYGKYTHSQRFTVSDGSGSLSELCINSSAKRFSDSAGLYTINGEGEAVPLSGSGTWSVITADGIASASLNGSGKTVTGDSYVISGSGWGHNVGMSQYGARAMAELGYGYLDILDFYFTGVDIG